MSRLCAANFGRDDDLIGELQHERARACRHRGVASRSASRSVGGDDRGVVDQAVGQARQRALADRVGVVGLLQRVHEPAQVVVGVVGDVGRHLRVAEIGCARCDARWFAVPA